MTRDQRGFTLMEGMTVLGIMTIILVMVTQIFAVSYDVFVKQSARAENETGAILASRAISDLARGAVAVEAARTVNGTSYASGPDALVLRLPAIAADGSVVTNEYDYAAVYRDPIATDEIWSDVEAAAGSARPEGKRRVTGNNETLTFHYNAADPTEATRVQLRLVNRKVARGVQIVNSAWTAIFLRNR